MAHFSVPEGTRNYFSRFQEPQDGNFAYHCLHGDLCQMGTNEQVLLSAGFPVVRSQCGTYPGFLEADLDKYLEALRYLWRHRVKGWWNEPLVEKGICTEKEFRVALKQEK